MKWGMHIRAAAGMASGPVISAYLMPVIDAVMPVIHADMISYDTKISPKYTSECISTHIIHVINKT